MKVLTLGLTLVGSLVSLSAAPALAGQLAINVSNVQLSQTVVYAGQSVDLTYTLSGSGLGVTGGLTNVRIEFLQNSTVAKTITLNPGDPGTAAGANTIVLSASDIPAGGPFTIRVTATGGSISGTGYIQISNNNDPNMQFSNPRGLDVNRVAGSPYLGRVYVTEGGGGATSNRNTVDGVYVLNPDLSPVFTAPKATNADLAAASFGPWGGTSNGPYRVVVGPDSSVYLTDGTDSQPAVYVADPDVSTVQSLFLFPGVNGATRDGTLVLDASANPLYGSMTSLWAEGTGASRTIYTMDEDLSFGNVMVKRVVPAGTVNSPALPEYVLGPMGSWEMDMVKDSAGNYYVVSSVTDDAIKYDSNGTEVARLTGVGAGFWGISIDDARNTILLSTNDGRVVKTDKAFTTATNLLTGLGNNVRDVAMDVDAWVYAVSATNERLYVYAPPGTYNVAGGNASSTQTIQVGGGGGIRGDVNNDGVVTVADAAIVLRIASGLE